MSRPMSLWIRGIGAWSPGLPGWPAWRALLRDEGGVDENAPKRPKPERLAAGERRRVSTHVLTAIETADQAVAMSSEDPAGLACVFASAHGDASIMDYMCAVLADTPQHLSPTRFHNSVHNAAVGYWTIATGCHAPSNAVAACRWTFGAGLLEAASQARVEQRPVLLVAGDEPGSGPLGEVMGTTRPFSCALVLSPQADPHAVARIDLALAEHTGASDAPRHAHARALTRSNLSADGLTLLEALANDADTDIILKTDPNLALTIHVTPV